MFSLTRAWSSLESLTTWSVCRIETWQVGALMPNERCLFISMTGLQRNPSTCILHGYMYVSLEDVVSDLGVRIDPNPPSGDGSVSRASRRAAVSGHSMIACIVLSVSSALLTFIDILGGAVTAVVLSSSDSSDIELCCPSRAFKASLGPPGTCSVSLFSPE